MPVAGDVEDPDVAVAGAIAVEQVGGVIEAGDQVGGAGRLDLVQPGGQAPGRRCRGGLGLVGEALAVEVAGDDREPVAAIHLADQGGGQPAGAGEALTHHRLARVEHDDVVARARLGPAGQDGAEARMRAVPR